MASKEEIMQKVNPDNSPSHPSYKSERDIWTDAMVSKCMDAARKDEAVAFAEFTCGKFKYNKFYKKWQQLYSNNEFTTEQLYTIFKQQNS